MPGRTAYFGLLEVGKPQPGETLVVAAASGAVGSAVGQIAKILGLKAIGIAGGREKCAYVRDELGFDDCLDYKEDDFKDRLIAACPIGVDIYFENVGGTVTKAVAPLLNKGSRVPICGYISNYNDEDITKRKLLFISSRVLTLCLSIGYLLFMSGRIVIKRLQCSWGSG
jgi:NADPH-dependent curcumin reductase CurA